METLTLEWKWRIAKRTPLRTWLTRARFFNAPPKDQVDWIRQYPPLWLDHYQAMPKTVLYRKVWRMGITRCRRLNKDDLAEICAYLML